MNEVQPSTLYIVATPIGNLEDITIRALNVLKNVDVIACEDTRHSIKLLNYYEIKKRLIAYHSYNEKNSAKGIVQMLQSGQAVALVSDGGMPCISDPGNILVRECRENDIEVTVIPGASACLTLLAASGFRTDEFFFHGFLSPKSGRRKRRLKELQEVEATHIFYESPYRLLKLLDDINEIFEKKMVCIGKELTKINEKILYGNCDTIKNELSGKKMLGEYVILVANY